MPTTERLYYHDSRLLEFDARVIGGELPRRPRVDDAAIVQHVGVVGDLQTHPRVLLDEEHGNSFAPHLRDAALVSLERRQGLCLPALALAALLASMWVAVDVHVPYAAGELLARIEAFVADKGGGVVVPGLDDHGYNDGYADMNAGKNSWRSF